MTLINDARAGKIPEAAEIVARDEGIDPEELRGKIAAGLVVIPRNRRRDFHPRGIGEGLRTKVNANLGTSPDHCNVKEELAKLEAAVEAGTDAVMDLSTGGNLPLIRRRILAASPVMVGTVPIYQTMVDRETRGKDFNQMDPEDLFSTIKEHLEDGVDFITVHCGVTAEVLKSLDSSPRVTGIVSRGGTLLALWMKAQKAENPLYDQFDRLLEMARRHDATLSLGDGLRPGCLADAGDAAQMAELAVLGDLARRAKRAGVQVMIEGPGHVPLDQIPAQIAAEKRLCDQAPFYVLGPLVTDVAPGYDHITSAIGGAVAAAAGADFLCYVTPAEHLRLPNLDDVREGVIASRIAAHAGDIAKGTRGADRWDRIFSELRSQLDWEGMFEKALDPVKARRYREESEDKDQEICTMCGNLCALKLQKKEKGK